MSDDLFLLSKRMDRRKYIIYTLSFIVGFILLELVGGFFTFQAEKTSYDLLKACSLAYQFTLVIFLNMMLFIFSYKRFKDINLSGLWGTLAMIIFIQIPVVIGLMCIKSRDVIVEQASEEVIDVNENQSIVPNDATITLYNLEENETVIK